MGNAFLYTVVGPRGTYYAIRDNDTGRIRTERTESAARDLAREHDLQLVSEQRITQAKLLALMGHEPSAEEADHPAPVTRDLRYEAAGPASDSPSLQPLQHDRWEAAAADPTPASNTRRRGKNCFASKAINVDAADEVLFVGKADVPSSGFSDPSPAAEPLGIVADTWLGTAPETPPFGAGGLLDHADLPGSDSPMDDADCLMLRRSVSSGTGGSGVFRDTSHQDEEDGPRGDRRIK